MAGRIKGITVEIGGDTTGLDKALRGVNSSIRNTQNSLRDVNRLLKLDPKNTELLSQKQRLLQSSIKDTSEKLNALKEADKQAKVQLENGTLGKDKYDALQREIIETENTLKSLQKEAKNVPNAISLSMKEVGDKIKNVGDKTVEVGKTMSTHVTAPIVGLGALSLAAFKEVDSGFDIIVSKTGASGKALDEMKSSMENIATSIPTDFATAGSAIGEVNTRFSLTGKALEDLSTQFIKFATLNNTDVSTSIDNTQKVMSAFSIKTEDAGALLDTLNKVGQDTGIGMDRLMNSLITNASALTQMGFNASDAATFLGKVEMSGADTTQVMSGLTKALSNATKEGKPMKLALSEIQDSMVNAKSDTEGLQIAYDLFGKKAGASIYDACKKGTLSFKELGTSLNDSLGNVNDTFNKTLDPMDNFKTTLNTIKVVGADVGSSLLNILKPVLEEVRNIINTLKEKWESLSPGMQDTIIKIGGILAVAGPLVIVIGKVISAVGIITSVLSPLGGIIASLITGITGVGIAGGASAAGLTASGTAAGASAVGFGAMSTALLPIIGIIAAIVIAIGSIVLVIKNWGAICEWFKNLWSNICDSIKSIGEGIGSFFSSLWDNVKNVTSSVWNGITGFLSSTWNGIKGSASSIFSSIGSFLSNTWNGIKSTASSVWGGITSFFSNTWNNIKGNATILFNGVKDTVSNSWNNLKTNTSNAWSNIKSTINSNGGGIKGVILTATQGYISIYKNAFDIINSATGGKLGSMLSTVRSKMSSIKASFVDKLSAARDFVKGAIDKIKGFFNFSWSLPKIKLPHFSISGSFSLMPPRIPHISVDWYKEGGILTRPTVFGMNGTSLMAGGEAGKEAVLPLNSFYKELNNMFKNSFDTSNVESLLSELISKSDVNIYIDKNTLVGAIAPSIDKCLGMYKLNKDRRYL